MVVEDVGSSQGECVRLLELEVENFPVIPFMSRLRSVQRSAEKARLENLESIRIENACVAADLGVQWSVVCRDFIKAGDKRPCLENVPLSLLMRRINMWMWLGAVPRCIVI